MGGSFRLAFIRVGVIRMQTADFGNLNPNVGKWSSHEYDPDWLEKSEPHMRPILFRDSVPAARPLEPVLIWAKRVSQGTRDFYNVIETRKLAN